MTPKDKHTNADGSYHGIFGDWDQIAWIKQPYAPPEDLKPGKEFYSPRVFPAADHPLVIARGPETRSALLTKRLFSYARFTALLERAIVNPVVLLIADNRLSLDFEPQVRADADVIYTDEAGHAQESNRVIQRVASMTNLAPTEFEPEQLNAYARTIAELPPELRQLARLFFGIVSETLISSTLSGIPRDPAVQPLISWYTAEHAKDEGRHHAFFAGVLTRVWPQLTHSQQEAIGKLVPKLMKIFLAPDVPVIAADLASLAFTREEIVQIVAETVTPPGSNAGMRDAARQAINHFRRVGALEIDAVRESFEDEGLIE